MMRSSIATYKESLSRIANEVQDAAQELEIPQSEGATGEDAHVSERRISRRFSRIATPTHSPTANGTDPRAQDEIAQFKADIQKLQASEAEIKALSFNYAAMLKEREEQLSRLREENSSLRKSFVEKDARSHLSRDESFKPLSNNSNILKGTADQSPSRRHKHTTHGSRSNGNHASNGNASKQDRFSNGVVQATQLDGIGKREMKIANSQGNEEELRSLLEANNRYLASVQASHESEINQLRSQLDNERENSTVLKLKLKEGNQVNECYQRELHDLKMDEERTSIEMKELRKELNEKLSELRRLQVEFTRRDKEKDPNESLESLKNMIRTLEKENAKLKIEKDEVEAKMKLCMKSTLEKTDADGSDSMEQKSIKMVKEEMTLSILELEKTLSDTCKERDKALQELARLKQHLLDKELEESDKMDEDSKIIEELQANFEYQRAHILQLEKALKQEIAKKEEFKKIKSDEVNKSIEIINDLRQRLANCTNTIDSKNVELLNLQTALGQYYAESEAKERQGRDLVAAREESAKLSESLKVANQGLEILRKEKEEIVAKLSQAERMSSEAKRSIQKLEEDNSKLRRALEKSMTTVNRMSLDSDNFVDRRIVIKLLVTYFQRNHSKEVLDLMVRMLGFSEEDKQRIGFAQQVAGKGVVRGVLGLPGRLVGGILGGSSPAASSHVSSENQSFADLWVDFLLKETEERERRESEEAARLSSSTQERSTSTARIPADPEHRTNIHSTAASFPTGQFSANQISTPLPSRQNQVFEHSDTEFATVPLTSSVSPSSEKSSKFSRPLPRY